MNNDPYPRREEVSFPITAQEVQHGTCQNRSVVGKAHCRFAPCTRLSVHDINVWKGLTGLQCSHKARNSQKAWDKISHLAPIHHRTFEAKDVRLALGKLHGTGALATKAIGNALHRLAPVSQYQLTKAQKRKEPSRP